MNPFRIVTIVVFAALALIAVFIFATFSVGNRESVGSVVVWGVLNEDTVEDVLNTARQGLNQYDGVEYTQLPEAGFSERLIEAIASGTGPDLVIVPSELVTGEKDKMLPISYRSFPRREFQDTFVEAGEVFLNTEGVYGLPFYIDPFVTFWNRTLFSNAGVPRAPRYWDEYTDLAPILSRATEGGTLTQSAVALGEWGNVNHAKEIFLSLVYGLGNTVISEDSNGNFVAHLSRRNDEAGIVPAESALRFYTDFADPVKVMYSWNRSQRNSFEEFVSGNLAVYFGRASETFSIREANPNLNFDVAAYPEIRNGFVAVPSRLYSLSIPRGSQNPVGALQASILLSSQSAQAELVSLTGLPSVRRDVLTGSPENPYEVIFRNAALNAFSFRDPDTRGIDEVLENMIEAVSSGRLRLGEAVSSGQRELEVLIR